MASLRKASVCALLLVVVAGSLAAVPCLPVARAEGESVDLQKLAFVITHARLHFYKESDFAAMFTGALRGALQALGDANTEYLTAEEYADLMTGVAGSFGGLGIYITSKDGYITVVSPIKGTPADRAGLRSGDQIVAVDGVSIKGITSERAIRLLRGTPGTSVRLGIRRKGAADLLQVTITRELIQINPVSFRMLAGKIGLIELSQFNEHTTFKLDEALRNLKAQGATALILDLRNNPGGLLNQAVSVTERFVPKGIILRISERGQPEQRLESSVDPFLARLPLAVLVNAGSASASEIVASAVKERGLGTIIGTQTFGKGTVQVILSFSDGSGIKVTTAEYLSAGGNRLEDIGVLPDIVVEQTSLLDDWRPLAGSRALKVGMVHIDVLMAQYALTTLGFSQTPLATGYYGSLTEAAVRAFQRARGLPVTGTLGPATAKALNDAVAEWRPTEAQDRQLQRAIQYLRTGR
ncbi:MAG: S41 family peptidase [Bacillota bacterium]